MRRVIQAFEHDSLKVGQKVDTTEFTEADLHALSLFHSRQEKRFFNLVHKGIKFTSYVGVIQVGGLTIEILPKVDKAQNVKSCAEEKQGCKDLLLLMLKRSGLIKLSESSYASLKLAQRTLLDIYIEVFLLEAEQLLHKGLRKSYKRVSGNVPYLKGRLLFNKQIEKNLINKDKFFTEHQAYNHNHKLNQILNEALLVLKQLHLPVSLSDKVEQLSLFFPEVGRLRISMNTFKGLSFDRLTSHYAEAIGLAELILLNFTPDFSAGRKEVMSVLFDMNDLFERFVFKELYRAQEQIGYSVKGQRRMKFWETKELKPDILLEKDGKTYVIDTKWKILDEANPSDADLKQMFAYNHYFDSVSSMLLYPKVADLSGRVGKYRRGLYLHDKGEVAPHTCSIGFVDLSLAGERSAISEEIFAQLDK